MSNELPVAVQQKKADELTPREIVRQLDTYVVGQKKAKRAVAIALRNRIRRMKLSPDMIDEVAPKNIIMIGPTGVGKTEIARRLSRLTQSPFIKVEASKFTEVGYVGRDVESMVRDLVEISVSMVKQEQRQKVREKARKKAEDRMLELLMPSGPSDMSEDAKEQRRDTREKLRKMLLDGKLDDREVEVQVSQNSFPSLEIITGQGVEEMGINLKEMMPNMFGGKKKPRKMKVGEAMEHLLSEEEEGLLDMDAVTREARKRAENSGIIFLDEIDKISGRESGGKGGGPDVSREGVQRDILPIVEGTSVTTKYGVVKTDHILFLAAGAFHVSKPSDLIPELQGRFPIRVELDNLTRDDFIRILTEPRNALTKQYCALMETEGLKLEFTEDAVAEISTLAEQVNERTENIGARRLHTIMERLLEEVSFHASEMEGQTINIDGEYVKNQLKDIVTDQDLSRYIL